MSLDHDKLRNTLTDALKTNFKKGKDDSWDSDKAAQEMAKAIADAVHAYVSAAQVTGVQVDVRNTANMSIGSGTQTNPVGLS